MSRFAIPGLFVVAAMSLVVPTDAGARQAFDLVEAVAAAQPGDTVRVPAGTYALPTVVIDKPIVILGTGRPVLDGGSGDHELLRIVADDVEIRGIGFRGVRRSFVEDRAAIRVDHASGCRIVDNRFDDVFFGIYLARSGRCVVEGNTFVSHAAKETDGGNAVHSWHSTGLEVRNNRMEGFRDGIYLEFTTDALVTGNLSRRNLRYGLHFMFSDRCRYEDNRFESNAAGVAVMYAHAIEMRRNRFSGAWGPSAYGLLLKELKDAVVEDNRFEANSVALFVEGTDRSRFLRNAFDGNGWAVKLMANAGENHFERNVFRNNTFDVSTNSRRAYSRFEGNFWDRYRGYDLDRDGTGDLPFRPVRLFSLLVERNEPALVLLRSVLVDALDVAERFLPVLTPDNLVDGAPLMTEPAIHDPRSELRTALAQRNERP